MIEINYTSSLGSLCHSTEILKRNKLRLCSYPFDWIFSNCDTVIDCVENDFNVFLDKSYYIHISPTKCGHSKYGSSMFNHHNPLRNTDNYDYYVRCVDRFKNLLKKQGHKLFIIIFPNMNNTTNDDLKNEMIEFNNKFSKYTSNYTLLVIFHIPNKEQNHNIFTCIDNIHFLELHTLSKSNGIEFVNKNDNIYLDNIINSKYIFNLNKIET